MLIKPRFLHRLVLIELVAQSINARNFSAFDVSQNILYFCRDFSGIHLLGAV